MSMGKLRVVLEADTAEDLMTPDPVSISGEAAMKDAMAFLIEKGFSAAPVIDQAGRPIGVISRTDLLIHSNQREGSRIPVLEIMTPVVFSVSAQVPAAKVVQEFLDLKVHRLFVVSPEGFLVGVICPSDVLRRLRPDEGNIPLPPPSAATAAQAEDVSFEPG